MEISDLSEKTTIEITQGENLVYQKTKVLTEKPMHYCPGCTHGVIHKAIAEVIDEMGIQEHTIGVAPVGCAVLAYEYIDIDWQQSAHGRAPAVATGTKRLMPDKYVFTYQGDGDLAAIGTAETIHACNRGENIVIIFVNNAIYGMTGGQMAPTTILNMCTSTTPNGRRIDINGHPLKITELVATLDGVCYVTRQSAERSLAVRKLKKAIRKGFEYSAQELGTSFIEVVSTCNSGWKQSPVKANHWMSENMFPVYPLGDLKDR